MLESLSTKQHQQQSLSNDETKKNCINNNMTKTNDDTLYKQYHGRFRKYRGQSVAQVLNEEKDVFDITTASSSSVIRMKGLICIPNCLSPTIQNYLNYKCVSQYTQYPPYMTNLSTSTVKKSTNCHLKKKAKVSMNDNLWEEYKEFNSILLSKKSKKKKTDPVARLYKKLTWSTVGYVYNWTQRCYQESYQAPMPPIFQTLAQSICKQFYNCSSQQQQQQQPNLYFSAQAGIINYYHLNSNGMGGHKDDAELTYEYPVISISLGLCPGIFLLQTSSTKVLPILLRPGDVILFHGPLRLALHGMPCVLQPEQTPPSSSSKDETFYQYNTLQDIGIKDDEKDITIPNEDVIHLKSYTNTHRININLRQVLPHDMTSIPSPPPPPPP